MGKYRDIMDEWFVRVWGQDDVACIYEKCRPSLKTTGHGQHALTGPEDFEKFHTIITALVKDIKIEIDQSVEDDEWFSMIYTFTGTNKVTGGPVNMTGSSMIRFKDDKIAEAHEHANFIEFFQGLGALPDNAIELGLSGKSIA